MMANEKSWAILIFLALIWGSSFWLIKQGLVLLTPVQLALLRIIIAAVCLLPYLLLTKNLAQLPWRWLWLVGLIGSVLPALLFATAQQQIPSAVAGMLNSLQPIFTLLISLLVFREPTSSKNWLGLFLATLGTCLLLLPADVTLSGGQTLGYAALIIVATVCYGLATNIIRHRCQGTSPVAIAAASLNLYLLPSIAIIVFTDFKLLGNTEIAITKPLLSIFILGSLGTAFALILFNRLIQAQGAVFASTVTYLIPVIAIGWGLLEREPLQLTHFSGILLILSGLRVIDSSRRK